MTVIEDLSNTQFVKIAGNIRTKLMLRRLQCCRDVQTRIDNIISGMDQLRTLRKKLEFCIARSWKGAAASVLKDVRSYVSEFPYDFSEAEKMVEKFEVEVSPLWDVFNDLLQVEKEFTSVKYDTKEEILSVTTEAIELEDLYLGEFEIQLHIRELVEMRRNSVYSIVALDPHPAGCNESVTHPHVRDEVLCAGDATVAIEKAMMSGRVCDFFTLVRSVLTTYNPSSPYVAIDSWNGTSCHECGHVSPPDESYYCNGCEEDYCEDCISYCHRCDDSYCCGCLKECPVCDDRYCEACMTSCPSCDRDICKTCLEQGTCPCHEEQEEEETNDSGDPEVANAGEERSASEQ